MSKSERVFLRLFGFGLAIAGAWLMLDDLSLKAAIGLVLLLWANNISQSRVE